MTREGRVPSEFDAYAASYRDIINRGAAITGESFEYFIGVRVRRVVAELGGPGAASRTRRILDFGCGIGATEQVLREHFPDAELHGVDESARSLEAADSLRMPRTWFHRVGGHVLPFDSGFFDLVYSNGTFHHIDHARHATVLAELARVLAPGGSAFVFENNPLNPVMVHNMRNNPFDADARMIFPWRLRRALSGAGLAARSPRYYAFFPKQLKAIRGLEPRLSRLPLGAQYYVRADKR
jgi:SAM-dependent methyltransferase